MLNSPWVYEEKGLHQCPWGRRLGSPNTSLSCCFYTPDTLHSVEAPSGLHRGASKPHMAVLFTVTEANFMSATTPMTHYRLLVKSCGVTSPQEGDNSLGLSQCLSLLPGWELIGLCWHTCPRKHPTPLSCFPSFSLAAYLSCLHEGSQKAQHSPCFLSSSSLYRPGNS